MSDPPKVFISYSHDNEAHKRRVLALADRLRTTDGVAAMIDRYVEPYPPEGWALWCAQQIESADFVLMVCTEVYHRRVMKMNKEKPGEGKGVRWETPIIYDLLFQAESVSKRFVPVLFGDGDPEHIPTPVRKFSRFNVDDPASYELLLRHLHDEPFTPPPPIGTPPDLAPMAGRFAAAPSGPGEAPQPMADQPHPLVEDVFAGRAAELRTLAACLLPADGRRKPAVVSGMGGVGKSYLVDRFYVDNKAAFEGGYVRIALDPAKPSTGSELLAHIADRLKLPAADEAALAARLASPLALLHVENVDTEDAAASVGDLALRVRGCALVASARISTLAASGWWQEVKLTAFDETTGLDQLRQELGEAAPADAKLLPLIRALGGLPLALHLAAGYLRTGETPDGFIHLLDRKGLSIEPIGPGDPTFMERSRKRLDAVFELSLDALRHKAEETGRTSAVWLQAFYALGYGPAAGFGESLGAALAGLAEDEFDDLRRAAGALSLLDRVPRGDGTACRLHPLLAELGRRRSDKDAAIARMAEWFVARWSETGEEEAWRWNEVHAETEALIKLRPQAPVGLWTMAKLARWGNPDRALAAISEAIDKCNREGGAERNAKEKQVGGVWNAVTLGHIADMAFARGQVDQGLRIHRAALLPVYERLGDAYIAFARGQLDEALPILREELLPVFERLNDTCGRAVTLGKIADILAARGRTGEALRICQNEELPVCERLCDVRGRAATLSEIADILEVRGELDEALRIWQEELLPAYERLGDMHARAITLGRIADILEVRGELDEALRIWQEELLPAYEQRGDMHARAITLGRIADSLEVRGELDEALRIWQEELLPAYERLGDVHARAITLGRIANILVASGDLDEALRIRQEELLPLYERLGDMPQEEVLRERGIADRALAGGYRVLRNGQEVFTTRDILVNRAGIAIILLHLNEPGDRDEAQRLLCLALADARRMQLPEAQQIEAILQSHGLSCA